MSSAPAYKRCRPGLGTFAEVLLHGGSAELHARVGEAAFAAIATVERAMSFHAPGSDLTRLNQAAVGRWVPLPAALLLVLQTALRLQIDTDGVFHIGVANSLMAWGVLPGAPDAAPAAAPDDVRPSFEVNDLAARRTRDRRLDLGGIAKGYAVDAAVAAIEALTQDAAIGGWVNIGGDLRVFGRKPASPVMVRLPDGELPAMLPCHLVRPAMATSSVRLVDGTSAFVDTRKRQPCRRACTVVAQAPLCMVADAFTKVGILLESDRARDLATRYDVQLAVLP